MINEKDTILDHIFEEFHSPKTSSFQNDLTDKHVKAAQFISTTIANNVQTTQFSERSPAVHVRRPDKSRLEPFVDLLAITWKHGERSSSYQAARTIIAIRIVGNAERETFSANIPVDRIKFHCPFINVQCTNPRSQDRRRKETHETTHLVRKNVFNIDSHKTNPELVLETANEMKLANTETPFRFRNLSFATINVQKLRS